jgi:glucose uptake protein
MSVAFPVGIGIALIWGVIVNYLKIPLGSPVLIFSGVLCIAVGIIINAVAYKKLDSVSKGISTKGLGISILAGVLMAQFYGFVVD